MIFDQGGLTFGEQLYSRKGHMTAAIAEPTRQTL